MIIIEAKDLTVELVMKINKQKRYDQAKNIGSIIKNCRLNRNLTLEQLCGDDCCVAYVSKMERNQNNTINHEILQNLCEKMDLDYENLIKSTNVDELKHALKDYLLGFKKALKVKVDKLKKDTYFSVTFLIACLYYSLIEDYSSLNVYMSKLDVLKSSMCPFELAIYLIILIDYSIKTYQYEEALRYYNLASKLDFDSEDITILLNEKKFLIDCGRHSKFLNNSDLIEYDYLNIKKYFDFNYPIYKQFELRNEYLKTLDLDAAKEIIYNNDIQIESSDESYGYFYTKCLVFTRLEMYKEVIDLIINCSYKVKCELICLFAFCIMKYLKRYNKIVSKTEKDYLTNYLKKLIKESKYENEDTLHLAFLRLMEFELDESEDLAIFNYIKKEVLVLFDKFDIAFYKEYVFQRFFDLSGKLTKYKDAYELFGKYFL